jgi:hypothetical protein
LLSNSKGNDGTNNINNNALLSNALSRESTPSFN